MSGVDIFVTSAQHNPLVYSEDVSAREAVRPPSARQITQHRCLAVRLVFVSLRSVAGVEANLLRKAINVNQAKWLLISTYVCGHATFTSRRITAGLRVR